jgi:CxxC motif-containing protein (DUF1111 family)
LTPTEKDFFTAARARFNEVDSVSGAVTGENGLGLGPTFNGNSCAQCHAQPAVGGTSPHPTLGQVLRENPQVGLATLDRVSGGEQRVPSFIHRNGPVREARFIRNANGRKDGGVHGLYTIAGRIDAVGCNLAQPDFAAELARGNVIFRIPTPVFGGGLIESVTDDALVANLSDNAAEKAALGIFGVLNRNGNDGTVTRFGWKAQNKSLLIFAGEAYNVEQGVSNELFPNERATAPGCQFNPSPEDSSNITNPIGGGLTGTASEMSSDTVNFAAFMRLSAAPVPKDNPTSGEQHGKELFSIVGCAHCHTPTLTTGESPFGGMSGIAIHPYSDFALHHMGRRLADYVDQGNAGPDQFRTAPLWGAGQRIFFLHDGRATPDNGGLVRAILAHESSNPSCSPGQLFAPDGTACHSEANAVIQRFRARSASDRQDILDFLRSL